MTVTKAEQEQFDREQALKSNTEKNEERIAKEKREKEDAAAKKKEAVEKQAAKHKKDYPDVLGGDTGILGAAGTRSRSRPKVKPPDETEEMEKDDLKELKDRTKKEVVGFVDNRLSGMDNADDVKSFGSGWVNGIGHEFSTLQMEIMSKKFKAQRQLKSDVMAGLVNDYWTGTGNLDMAKISGRASEMVGDKPTTRRSGLDKLQEDGAPEMDMPEIPDDAAAYIAETATAMVGDIIQNIVAMSQGGTSLIAKSQVAGPGQRTADKVAAMMTMDVAQHREKVDKIRLLNQQLEIQHGRDVMAAMVDFDNRSAADERAYNTNMFQAKGMEVANAFKAMDMQQEYEKYRDGITMFVDAQVNARNQNIDTQTVALKRFNKNLEMQNVQEVGRNTRAAMKLGALEKKMAQEGRLIPYKKITKYSAAIQVSGIDNLDSTLGYLYDLDKFNAKKGNTPLNARNRAAGNTRGSQVYSRINDMEGLTKKQKGIAMNNIVVAATLFGTLNDLTDATIKDLTTEKMTLSPKGYEWETGGRLMRHFKKRSGDESIFVAGQLKGMLDSAANAVEFKIQQVKNRVNESSASTDIDVFTGD